MIYKIDIFDKKSVPLDTNNFTEIKHKFLYDSLYKDIKYSKSENSIQYLFFDTVLIKIDLEKTSNNDQDKMFNSYYGYYQDSILSDQEISKLLRNSSTLVINEKNSYEDKNMKIVFAEKGFVFCSKRDDRNLSETFERVLFLFVLAGAYNAYSDISISNVSESFRNKDFDKMIKTRDDIYSFDVRCFFHNPIKMNRHQTFDLWNMISSNYYIKPKYDEMKSQISDLANIIEIKQQKTQEEKNKKFERLVAIIGIILAATSLLGFYLDLKEVGLFG